MERRERKERRERREMREGRQSEKSRSGAGTATSGSAQGRLPLQCEMRQGEGVAGTRAHT